MKADLACAATLPAIRGRGAHSTHLPQAELARMHQADLSIRCAILDCRSQPALCKSWLAEPLSIMRIWQGLRPPMRTCATTWRRVPLDGADDSLRRLWELRQSGDWIHAEIWDGLMHSCVGALGRRGAEPI